MWSAWNRFLGGLPSWLGIQIVSLVLATVLCGYVFLRTSGSLGLDIVPIWFGLLVVVDGAMLGLWMWKGYSLSAPPLDREGNRITSGGKR